MEEIFNGCFFQGVRSTLTELALLVRVNRSLFHAWFDLSTILWRDRFHLSMLFCLWNDLIRSSFISVQFQILRKLSQDPVATAIPSSVTPRQLTRLSWPASTPEKVQSSVNHTVFYSQLWNIIFTKIIGVYFTIKHFQFFYLKMLLFHFFVINC